MVSQSRNKNEDQSVVRAGSIYRSESISSISQTMKGTRWSFGSKLETDEKNTFIFIPQECIKIRYRVLEILTATAYGEIMRIQLQSKAAEEKKVGEGQEGSLRANKAPNFEGAYFLITVQKSKFSKEETKFYLKQTKKLIDLAEFTNVSRIHYMSKSQNMFFYITKEPQCLINSTLIKKIDLYRCYQKNKVL